MQFVSEADLTRIHFKPDVQWIINPDGVKSADDALMFTLRLDVVL